MSTSELRSSYVRAFVLVGGIVFGAIAVRCAPTGQCLRMSDCASGETCSDGLCHADTPDLGDADPDAPTATDAPAKEAAATADATKPDSAIVDSGIGDAADAEASSDF